MAEAATVGGWAGAIIGIAGFATAFVTNYDKMFPAATAAKVTSASNFGAYRTQNYITPQGGITPAFVKKWNADCVAEGQRQLTTHNFAVYSINESAAAGGAQFPNSQELLMLITCNAVDQHLSYSAFAVGPSTEAGTVNQMVEAIMYGMNKPGASFGY